MIELDRALYSKLTGGTALTALLASATAVYHLVAPPQATYPYVVFNLQGGGPENQTPSDMRDYLEFVRGYGTSLAVVQAIDAQISALLRGRALSVSGYDNWWTSREMDEEAAYLQANQTYLYMAGAVYRVRIDS